MLGVLASLTGPALAQLQFEQLLKRYLPAHADSTGAVVLEDVDGDGDADIVFGNGGQNRLLMNDGAGRFAEVTTTHMPFDTDSTVAVGLGDVDGDGDPDLVSGNSGQQNRLYLNDGTGRFTDATATRMPFDTDWTAAVALGDVDGDGDLDLLFGNAGTTGQQNRLYLNDGTGTFIDVTTAAMPSYNDGTRDVALGDVDADGDLDMVLGNVAHQNRLYLNNGGGTFTDVTAMQMPMDSDATFAVALSDADGDGDYDLVFGNQWAGNSGQNRLYVNDGTGLFTDVTAARMPTDGDWTVAVTLADADGDGDPDILFGNVGQNRFYRNDGAGTFTDCTVTHMPTDSDWTTSVAVKDVDGDGDLDAVLGHDPYLGAGQNRLYLNDGTGTFADTSTARLPTDSGGTNSVLLGDVDGDGDADLVFGNSGGWGVDWQNRLCLNDGSGTFTDATAARMPADIDNTAAVALEDIDGDGDLDLVFGNMHDRLYMRCGQNRLYLNDGTGTFSDATATHLPALDDNTWAVALEDVDGDGDPDLVFGNSGQNRLYLNDGTGRYSDATTTRMPIDTDQSRAAAFGDVDGDGDPDLVFGNSGQNRVYLNSGMGTFTDATTTLMPIDNDSTRALVLGDVDGDGDLDLLLGNSGQNRLYSNDGTGAFTDVTATHLPTDTDDTSAAALGDVDDDGDVDLVFGNGGFQGQTRIYLNDGSGTFTDATAARMPTHSDSTGALALGDVDGDGDPDLILGNLGQNRLYLNLLRQLDAPFLVIPGREYQLDVYARYGPPRLVDVALPYVSAATARIPLPPFGTLGLDPASLIPLPPFVIPQPAGVGSVTDTIPNNPSLIGLSIHAQALLLQWPGGAHLTNVMIDRIIR